MSSSSNMEESFEVIEENAGAYGELGEAVGAGFKGLCTAFAISDKCFQNLVEDGWDDAAGLKDLSEDWKRHVLALAPNGAQRCRLEKVLQRIDVGPLDESVPKKKRRLEVETEQEAKIVATAASGNDAGAGPSGEVPGATAQASTSSKAQTALEVHKPLRMELLQACLETGYDKNVAYVMSLLRKYVGQFNPLSVEDLKEQQLYTNLLSECNKHVEKKTEGVAMYIYKSITGEDSDKRLRFARKHLGLSGPPVEGRSRPFGRGGLRFRSGPQPFSSTPSFRRAPAAVRPRDVCYRCQKRGHFARDCKEII